MPWEVIITPTWTLQVAEQQAWPQTLRVLAEEMEPLARILH